MTRVLMTVVAMALAVCVSAQPADVSLEGGKWRSIVDLSVISFGESGVDGAGTISVFRGGGAGLVYGWTDAFEVGVALMFSSVEVATETAEREREAQMVVYVPVKLLDVLDIGPTFQVWDDAAGWWDEAHVGMGVNVRLFSR